jgi:hypothetical protein
MDKNLVLDISDGMAVLLNDKTLHAVTVFRSPLKKIKERIRITRAKNGNGYHLDIGRPNYRENQWIKLCKKAGGNPRRIKYWFFAKPKHSVTAG